MQNNAMIPEQYATLAWQDWIDDAPIQLKGRGCPQGATCSGNISAPGLAEVNCTEQTWALNSEMLRGPHGSWGPFHYHADQSLNSLLPNNNVSAMYNSGFLVNMWPQSQSTATVSPEIWWIQTGLFQAHGVANMSGQYTLRNCSFAPAIAEYSVDIHDGTLELPADMSSPRIISLANNTVQYKAASSKVQPQTLELFGLMLLGYVNSNVTLTFSGPPSVNNTWVLEPNSLNSYGLRYLKASTLSGDIVFEDPLSDIVSKFNNIMVRASVLYAKYPAWVKSSMDPGVSMNQTLAGNATTSQNVFVSDFRWFVGAALLGEVI